MEIILLKQAQKDKDYWLKSGQKKIQKRISELLLSIRNTPTKGIGKPQQLKLDLSGKWSRRINNEHRVVYQILDDKIIIFSMIFHY